MSFRFEKYPDIDNHHDTANVTVDFKAVGLEDVLEYFEMFLKGCGYSFDGKVTIVNDEEPPKCDDTSA